MRSISLSKFRMSPSDNGNSSLFPDICNGFDFWAKFSIYFSFRSTNTHVDYVGLCIQYILNFFIQPLILAWEMTTSTAFHKSCQFKIFSLVLGKSTDSFIEGT